MTKETILRSLSDDNHEPFMDIILLRSRNSANSREGQLI